MNAGGVRRIAACGSAVLMLAGCARTSITGEHGRHEQVLYGTAGVIGEDHHLTILAGSEVLKLSIIGESNEIVVEDGAVVDKVEIIGEDNRVILPAGNAVDFSEIGEDNHLEYRPARASAVD
ncbi:MAG: hypothetical protein GY842_15245 [bacterium]|nr:hypothetical protein [bacterium]